MQAQNKWIKIALINLSIVAFIGAVMRYKIGFAFPYFDQKYLQHGHSHFAFAGWISHLLYVFFYYFLVAQSQRSIIEAKYKLLINANLVCAYGMLIAFILQGYGMFSIFFSSTSVLISFVYAWNYIRDVRKHAGNHPSAPWMILALLFNVLSCIGTFALAYMMATKHFNQHLYLGSVYFYLHFQ